MQLVSEGGQGHVDYAGIQHRQHDPQGYGDDGADALWHGHAIGGEPPKGAGLRRGGVRHKKIRIRGLGCPQAMASHYWLLPASSTT
ncbi:hypothetical protein GCM10023095_08790 [Pseudaeromonas paramecii]|uniref:Uncharacterized protein n=1 Tax=Pseudaeromonas paramecii TaxID=2138166 RepID=A0ABP8Q087_9GAMM